MRGNKLVGDTLFTRRCRHFALRDENPDCDYYAKEFHARSVRGSSSSEYEKKVATCRACVGGICVDK